MTPSLESITTRPRPAESRAEPGLKRPADPTKPEREEFSSVFEVAAKEADPAQATPPEATVAVANEVSPPEKEAPAASSVEQSADQAGAILAAQIEPRVLAPVAIPRAMPQRAFSIASKPSLPSAASLAAVVVSGKNTVKPEPPVATAEQLIRALDQVPEGLTGTTPAVVVPKAAAVTATAATPLEATAVASRTASLMPALPVETPARRAPSPTPAQTQNLSQTETTAPLAVTPAAASPLQSPSTGDALPQAGREPATEAKAPAAVAAAPADASPLGERAPGIMPAEASPLAEPAMGDEIAKPVVIASAETRSDASLSLLRSADPISLDAKAVTPSEGRQLQSAAGQDRTQAILDQVKLHLEPKRPEITLQLEPKDLGRLVIRLSMRGSELSARVTATELDTAMRLDRDAPLLFKTLGEAGLKVAQVEVRHGGLENQLDGQRDRNLFSPEQQSDNRREGTNPDGRPEGQGRAHGSLQNDQEGHRQTMPVRIVRSGLLDMTV